MRFWPASTGARLRAIIGMAFLSIAVAVVVYWSLSSRPFKSKSRAHGSTPEKKSIFSDQFPGNNSIGNEITALKTSGRLTEENETLIRRTVSSAANSLEMPPAILWCLLFQESRLNHLSGIEGDVGALGLGQFSHFSFYEINHQLERFDARNKKMFLETLGQDVRPVLPKRNDVYSHSSYYFIPTAVASSASYLNNRYAHLEKLLGQRGLDFDEELLWLYSVMAYNKGTKSVLAIWNTIARKYGVEGLKTALKDTGYFLKLSRNEKLVNTSLRRIWEQTKAKAYSKELLIHIDQISRCALKSETLALHPTTGGHIR